jgi:hypothetical protein
VNGTVSRGSKNAAAVYRSETLIMTIVTLQRRQIKREWWPATDSSKVRLSAAESIFRSRGTFLRRAK